MPEIQPVTVGLGQLFTRKSHRKMCLRASADVDWNMPSFFRWSFTPDTQLPDLSLLVHSPQFALRKWIKRGPYPAIREGEPFELLK